MPSESAPRPQESSRHTPCAVRSTTILLSISIFLVFFLGCEHRTNIRPVTGKITLNGQPLADASVSFQPLVVKGDPASEGMGSYGRTNNAGEFELRLVDTDELGAVIGTHSVRISLVQRGMGDAEISSADEALPLSVRDGSEQFTVKPEGENVVELDLKSK